MQSETRLHQRKLTHSVHGRGQHIRPEKRLQTHVQNAWDSQSKAEQGLVTPREMMLDEYLETAPGSFAARRALDAIMYHDEKGSE